MLKYMVAKSKDPDFHSVLQLALDASSRNVAGIKNIFNSILYPVPKAFGDEDVDVNARELFAEEFSVRYTKQMQKFILINYTLGFSNSSRSDIKHLFSDFVQQALTVIEKVDEVMLAKGLFPKSPYIEPPDQVEFVRNKNFYGSFFGKSERPLNAVEIGNLFDIISLKTAMRTLKQGFSQVTKSDKVQKHLNRGIEMADKQLKVLGHLLENDGLPRIKTLNDMVTGSTQPPFSDKLIMFHTTIAMARIILAYGFGLTDSARKDVISVFLRLTGEILNFSKDGVDIMIENGWLEKVPEAIDRDGLRH